MAPPPAHALRRVPMLYHFTDRRNLASIRERGGLYPLATLRRNGWAVPAPGGNQARSCALFVALMRRGELDQVVASPTAFTELMTHHDRRRDPALPAPQAALWPGPVGSQPGLPARATPRHALGEGRSRRE